MGLSCLAASKVFDTFIIIKFSNEFYEYHTKHGTRKLLVVIDGYHYRRKTGAI